MAASFREKCIGRCAAWQGIKWDMAIFATLADYGLQLPSHNRNMHIQGTHLQISVLETLAAYSRHVLPIHDDMQPSDWGIHTHQKINHVPSTLLETHAANPSCRLLIDGDVHPYDDGGMCLNNGGMRTHHEGSYVPSAVLDTHTADSSSGPLNDGHKHLNDRGLHSVEGCIHPIEGSRHPIDCDAQLIHATICQIDPVHTNLRNPNGHDAGAHTNIPSMDGKKQEIDIASPLQGPQVHF